MGGRGGSFKLNKQEVRCMEESTSVSGLGFFFVVGFFCWFFLKGTELYCMFFIFNPENLYREDRKISSTQYSLEYKTFCDYGFPVNFFKMERSSFTKTEIQRFFFKPLYKPLLLFPTAPPTSTMCPISLVRLKRQELILHGRFLLTSHTVWSCARHVALEYGWSYKGCIL